MKKLLLLLTFMISSTALLGCESTKYTITYGMKANAGEYSLINLDYGQLKLRMDPTQQLASETFLLLVLPESCACRDISQKTMVNYSEKYHTVVYKMEAKDFYNYENYGIVTNSVNSLLYLISETKIITELSYNYKNGLLKNVDFTHDQVKRYFNDPKNFYMTNFSYLDTLIANKEDFSIEYIRTGCGDCLISNPEIIWKHGKDITYTNDLYILDIQPLRGTPEYDIFKGKVGLTYASNNKYGYSGGVVPTLQHYTDGVLDDACVIFNESFIENGTGYKVSESFFDETRIDYIKYLDKNTYTSRIGVEVESNYSHEEMLPYYTAVVNSFLNYYLK